MLQRFVNFVSDRDKAGVIPYDWLQKAHEHETDNNQIFDWFDELVGKATSVDEHVWVEEDGVYLSQEQIDECIKIITEKKFKKGGYGV